MTFQDMLIQLEKYWSDYGCVLTQPYSSEVGAGTFNPETFLRVLGPEPWKVAYVEPSRRPKDGRYGDNPFRVQRFYQYQVILKPAPFDVLDVYFKSLEVIGIKPKLHDLRLVEDDWESPTLGAWGLGWQVWLDGLEITQFTYFQQSGGIDLNPISAEITYGLERIATVLQGAESFSELRWSNDIKWGELFKRSEYEFSKFNYEESEIELHKDLFNRFEKEAVRLLEKRLVLPGYDYVIKCSHLFNVLEARGAISITERVGYIGRVRRLARKAALAYLAQREELGYPLLASTPAEKEGGRA